MNKIFICITIVALFLVSCAPKSNQEMTSQAGGIVPKPDEKREIKPSERANMMILMQAETAAEELDEVIVIPPKDKKTAPQ